MQNWSKLCSAVSQKSRRGIDKSVANFWELTANNWKYYILRDSGALIIIQFALCSGHWSLKPEGCLEKSLNGRLHAKERSWRGLQFAVSGDNIHWRKHQLNGFYFLQWEGSKRFVTLAILYLFLIHVKSVTVIDMQERNTM